MRAVFTALAVKQIKVRLLRNGELSEKESRTSMDEKQGRLLSEGAWPGPQRHGPTARLDFRKKRRRGNIE